MPSCCEPFNEVNVPPISNRFPNWAIEKTTPFIGAG